MIVDHTIHTAIGGQFHAIVADAVRGKPGVSVGTHLHLNVGDVSPPGFPLRDVLETPESFKALFHGWAEKLPDFDRGVPSQIEIHAPIGYSGASIEGEDIVPVPHYTKASDRWPSVKQYAAALRDVVDVIRAVCIEGRPLAMYGAGQITPAHIWSPLEQHAAERRKWYEWYGPGGCLRWTTPAQQFYITANLGAERYHAWASAALDRLQWTEPDKPVQVFVTPEVDQHHATGGDGFADALECGGVPLLRALAEHPKAVRLVMWGHASSEARAMRMAELIPLWGETVKKGA
jgi:hypothetical protein